MAGLARRIAPAAALGGLAVIAVGLLDPALGGADAAPTAGSGTTTTTAPKSGTGGSTATGPGSSGGQQGSSGGQGAATTCDAGEQVTGDAAATPWGPVQVVATVAGGELCEVHAIAYPANDHRSAQINAYAIPALDESASQNGAEFDFVSGATYTSRAYAESLQSILDSM